MTNDQIMIFQPNFTTGITGNFQMQTVPISSNDWDSRPGFMACLLHNEWGRDANRGRGECRVREEGEELGSKSLCVHPSRGSCNQRCDRVSTLCDYPIYMPSLRLNWTAVTYWGFCPIHTLSLPSCVSHTILIWLFLSLGAKVGNPVFVHLCFY